jgi:hypothetical protein
VHIKRQEDNIRGFNDWYPDIDEHRQSFGSNFILEMKDKKKSS